MSDSGSQWSLLPVVALRQAGFAFDMLSSYAYPQAVRDSAEFAAAETRLRLIATQLKRILRESELPDRVGAASALGMLRPLAASFADAAGGLLPAQEASVLHDYQALAAQLADRWQRWENEHQARLADSAAQVVASFQQDDLLRDVLLLSNDENYPLFESWLAAPGEVTGRRGRKMVDLLTKYLQRVTTKNETHSHFGPVTAGSVDRTQAGVSWSRAEPQRVAYFSHWAAEQLAVKFGSDTELFERVRPRRRPWAFLRDGQATLYAFTTEGGLAADWRFTAVGSELLDEQHSWLLEHCDGVPTVSELRALFAKRFGARDADFDGTLEHLARCGLAVARFETPVGAAQPLRELRRQMGEGDLGAPKAQEANRALAEFEQLLDDLAHGPLPSRPATVHALKERFSELSGKPAHRGSGRHYADRSVFFEECHSPVRDFRIGHSLASFIENELAPVYELALAGPRLRVIRENAALADWVSERFGVGVQVPLDRLYEAYFADRPSLLRLCDGIDAELDRLDLALTSTLLGDMDTSVAEVEVPPDRLTAFLERCPTHPTALCNPDVMLAAADVEALDQGDFLAVVGDCHAVRELLTHTSFAPLLQQHLPDLPGQAVAAYQRLLEDDELLCDMARSHPDKTATQIPLTIPDVEIFGRSAKPRSQVIQPARMNVVAVSGGGIELRAQGIPQRLRLLAPPAGGPSIRQDPLSPFAFPRKLGGLGLRAVHLTHVPRIRIGRTVLQRELWRIPVGELRGIGIAGFGRTGDAAEFYAACRLRERHRLPQYLFAKFATEPKPLYVDFESPLLVRQLFRIAQGATGQVQFIEMLPGPDQLWLTHEGKRYTTEIRCAVFSS
jgi:hypothetical protein